MGRTQLTTFASTKFTEAGAAKSSYRPRIKEERYDFQFVGFASPIREGTLTAEPGSGLAIGVFIETVPGPNPTTELAQLILEETFRLPEIFKSP